MENAPLHSFDGAADWLPAVADPTRIHILLSLSQGGAATATELASAVSSSHQTLRRHLEALVVSGVLRENPGQSDGETPGRPASRFSLSRPEIGESVQRLLGASSLISRPTSTPSAPD